MSSTSAGIQIVEFMAALSKAWKKLTAYPPGHPEVVGALAALEQRLAELRGPAGEVALGVNQNSLVYGSSDITTAGAQKLAQTLYSRGVAIVRFGSETRMDEIEAFLRLLGGGGPVDPRRILWEELTAAGVLNINLQPVDYGTIHVSEGLKDKKEEGERSLWDEVLHALLRDEHFAHRRELPEFISSADELAQMIAEYAATAVDKSAPVDAQATFGIQLKEKREEALYRFFFQTVGHHIAESTGQKRQNSLEQAVQLLRTLPEQLRRALICAIAEALSSDESAAALLHDFASELPTDEVLDALRYLSSMEKLSGHSLTLLRSMTALETSKTEMLSKDALADVIRLFGEDDVARFNPTEHDAVLRRISVEIPMVPHEATVGLDRSSERPDPAVNPEIVRHLAEVLFDLVRDPELKAPAETIFGRLESGFTLLLDGEEYEYLENIIQRLLATASSGRSVEVKEAAKNTLGSLSDMVVERVSTAPDEQILKLRRLIDLLADYARQSSLEKLAVESNRSRRRRLLNFIAAQGTAIVPHVVGYLKDERWYVVRNMIVLLRAVKDRTALPELRKLARHADLRVRMEAIKTLFAFDSNVPPMLLDNLFEDPDPKVGQTAVGLAGSYRIREAVDPLLRILNKTDYLGARRALRIRAIKSLGEIGDARALDMLERQKLFSSFFLPWPPKDERYAAWESLAGYPAEARTKLIESGLKSSDGHVREICARIGGV